jgi:hypothetical protein
VSLIFASCLLGDARCGHHQLRPGPDRGGRPPIAYVDNTAPGRGVEEEWELPTTLTAHALQAM